MRDQDRMQKFASKFMDEGITKDDLKSTGFFRSDMLYWIINLFWKMVEQTTKPNT